MAKAHAERTVAELEDLVCRLSARKERIEQTLRELKAESQRVSQELNTAQQALAQRCRRTGEPTVSAHALVRYLERFLDVDVAAVEKALLSPEVKAAIRAGATRITVNGVGLVVKDNVIVTVVD